MWLLDLVLSVSLVLAGALIGYVLRGADTDDDGAPGRYGSPSEMRIVVEVERPDDDDTIRLSDGSDDTDIDETRYSEERP